MIKILIGGALALCFSAVATFLNIFIDRYNEWNILMDDWEKRHP